MFQVVLLTALTALGQADTAAASAGSGPQADVQAHLQRLARQLESDERLKREQAQAELIKLGPAIVDLIPPLLEKARTAEARHRLEQVQEQLQDAQAAGFARGRTVTLHSDAMPLADVLAELTRQTGNPIVDFRKQFNQEQSNVKLKVDFEKTPFWQALDSILDQAQLTLYPYSEKAGLAVVARGEGDSPRSGQATYLGAFRLQASRVIAERDLRQAADRMLRVTLELAWEPRLAPINLVLPMDQIQAIDEQGRNVPIRGSTAMWEIPVRGGQAVTEFPLPFALPPRDALKIASLKGKMIVVTPSKTESFQFDEVATKKNVEQRRAGVTVTLDQARKNNDVWEVRVKVRFDETFGALESHRGWIFENDAYLVDADKKVIQNGGLEKTSQTQEEIGLSYLFNVPGGLAGHSFVYKTPAAILRLPIEFEIKDVELP